MNMLLVGGLAMLEDNVWLVLRRVALLLKDEVPKPGMSLDFYFSVEAQVALRSLDDFCPLY